MLTIRDIATGAELDVPTGNAKLRQQYADAASVQRAAIANSIRRAGADHLQLRTDRDWLLDLASFVSGRRDRIDAQSRAAAHGSGDVGSTSGAGPIAGVTR